jgi:hypothetical protein
VDHALAVGVVHGLGQLPHEHGGVAGRLRRTGDLLVQAAAVDVFQREVGAAVVLADLVDVDDVGVLELGGGLGLAAEAGPVVFVGVLAGADHLQGDRPLQAALPGQVDHAHAAAAEHAQDVVARHRRPVRGPVAFRPLLQPGLGGVPGHADDALGDLNVGRGTGRGAGIDRGHRRPVLGPWRLLGRGRGHRFTSSDCANSLSVLSQRNVFPGESVSRPKSRLYPGGSRLQRFLLPAPSGPAWGGSRLPDGTSEASQVPLGKRDLPKPAPHGKCRLRCPRLFARIV